VHIVYNRRSDAEKVDIVQVIDAAVKSINIQGKWFKKFSQILLVFLGCNSYLTRTRDRSRLFFCCENFLSGLGEKLKKCKYYYCRVWL
jgi:hypothetical protein